MDNINKDYNICISSYALNSVKKMNKEECNTRYKTLVKKLPTLILSNGLIATLTFLLSKGKNEHFECLEQIREWVVKQDLKINNDLKNRLESKDKVEFIEKLAYLTSREYKFLTKEIINMSLWLKRFADGMIEDKPNGDANEN